MLCLMTAPDHDDDVPNGEPGNAHDEGAFAFDADDDNMPEHGADSRDVRRVGLVLGIALVVLIALVLLLLQVLGNVFGDMWDKVFTF
jgi:hypothetical protein